MSDSKRLITRANVDVLSVGFACIDINFVTKTHPARREKVKSHQMNACGGGPASNAALTIARLGGKTRFHGYIGDDGFGRAHVRELHTDGVLIDTILRGKAPTPIASITIKPDGARSIVSYRDPKAVSKEDSISLKQHPAKALLLDGHQAALSIRLAKEARTLGIPIILDAGSINEGTEALHNQADYLVASAKFAYHLTGITDPYRALEAMKGNAPFWAVTSGADGIYWQTDKSTTPLHMEAFKIEARDTTGAGDAFHGAFALGVAQNLPIVENIRRASACGALTCLRIGARNSLPTLREVENLMTSSPPPPYG